MTRVLALGDECEDSVDCMLCLCRPTCARHHTLRGARLQVIHFDGRAGLIAQRSDLLAAVSDECTGRASFQNHTHGPGCIGREPRLGA